MKIIPAEPPFLHSTGTKVLDQHVDAAGRDQVADQPAALLVAQIDGHRSLVASHRSPPQRGTLVQLSPASQRIADPGRLDLDDLGPEAGEHRPGEGTGDQLTELEHPKSGEGLLL